MAGALGLALAGPRRYAEGVVADPWVGEGTARAAPADIGRALFISEATVKTHLLRAFGKLGVSDRTAAVTRAIELGMLPAPGSAC